MKNIRFFICILFILCVTTSFAQIGIIETEVPKNEFEIAHENVWIMRDASDGSYKLIVGSDNQFEDEVVFFNLGIGEEESINSLVNLNNAIQNPGVQFTLEGHTIRTLRPVDQSMGMLYKEGELEYAAGAFYFKEQALSNAMLIVISHVDTFQYGDIQVKTVRKLGHHSNYSTISFVSIEIYVSKLKARIFSDLWYVRGDFERDASLIMSNLPDKGLSWNTNDLYIVKAAIEKNLLCFKNKEVEKIFRQLP